MFIRCCGYSVATHTGRLCLCLCLRVRTVSSRSGCITLDTRGGQGTPRDVMQTTHIRHRHCLNSPNVPHLSFATTPGMAECQFWYRRNEKSSACW